MSLQHGHPRSLVHRPAGNRRHGRRVDHSGQPGLSGPNDQFHVDHFQPCPHRHPARPFGRTQTMRVILIFFCTTIVVLFCFAADPVPPNAADTSKLYIFSEDGVTLSPGEEVFLVYRKNVQVFESDMYLECELLTLLQQTNKPARPASGGLTNFNAQADTIIAETNLMVMARGTTLLGDRGVYTKSNETIIVTGTLVVIERSNMLVFATNFVFNRLTSSGHAVGWTETEVELSGAATNAPKAGFGPIRKTGPAP